MDATEWGILALHFHRGRYLLLTGVCTYRCMARKVQKSLNLPIDVVEPLEEEDNQSEVVEELLREKYDL